jgi:hypothetical protein
MITGGLTAASMVMSYLGGSKASEAAKQQSQLSAANAGLEMQVDQQRQAMMEINAKRQMTEVTRNMQRARAMSLASETSQGAQFGSISGGAQGAVSGQGNFNLAGIDAGLTIGRNIFGLNQQIDQNKIGMAQLGGDIATGQGMMAFGGALGNSITPLSNLGIAGANGAMKGFNFFSKPGLIGMP